MSGIDTPWPGERVRAAVWPLLSLAALLAGCGKAPDPVPPPGPGEHAVGAGAAGAGKPDEEMLAGAQLATLRCTDGGNRKRRCETDLTVEHRCADCFKPVKVNLPAFLGKKKVEEVWPAYLGAIQGVMGAARFQAQPESPEADEVCFTRSRAPSAVLGGPYFEDARYCVRALKHVVSEMSPPQPGVRIRFTLVVSVSKTPHAPPSAYREPEPDELEKYEAAVNEAYFAAVEQACAQLRGRLNNHVCDVR